MVRYASRWSIEVMFSQIRNLLGAGQARNRVQAAVGRTFSFQLIVYSIVVVWHVLHACGDTDVRQRHACPCPWYRTKTAPSYEDMLTRLRLALAEAPFSAIPPGQRPPHENPIALVTLTSAAAKVQTRERQVPVAIGSGAAACASSIDMPADQQ